MSSLSVPLHAAAAAQRFQAAAATLPATADVSVRTYSASIIVSLSLFLLGLVPTIARFTACTAEARHTVARRADDLRLPGLTPGGAESTRQRIERACSAMGSRRHRRRGGQQ